VSEPPNDEADKDDYQTHGGGGKDYVVSEVRRQRPCARKNR
jgi:hypothetical protein